MLHKIESKIVKIEELHRLLREIGKDCKEKFLTDRIYQGALLHYLYLISGTVLFCGVSKILRFFAKFFYHMLDSWFLIVYR